MQEEVEDKKRVWIRGLQALGTRRCNEGWHKGGGGGGGGGIRNEVRMPKVELDIINFNCREVANFCKGILSTLAKIGSYEISQGLQM